MFNAFDVCANETIVNEVKGYFTSEDIITMNEYFNAGNNYSLEGLIQFFDARIGCNRVVRLLNDVISRGIKIMPQILFHPVTEKCVLENGEFTINQVPYSMGDSIFINNLIVVKNSDNTYDFYDDVEFDLVNLKCSLNDKNAHGTATVSYFVLDQEHIGGLDYMEK